MRKPIAILAAVAVTLLVAYLLVRWLESDETRVRRRIDEMAAAFNAPDVGDCLVGLHEDLELRGPRGGRRIDRDQVATYLRYLVLTRHDKEGRYNLEVELPAERVLVEIEPGAPHSGRVRLLAIFRETEGDQVKREATVDIDAELTEDEEHGWQIRGATWTSVEGKLPF